jgi:hypothetical protein
MGTTNITIMLDPQDNLKKEKEKEFLLVKLIADVLLYFCFVLLF